MSIRLRFLTVLGLLLAAFLATLWMLRQAEQAQIRELVSQVRHDGQRQLTRWVDVASLPVRQLALEFAPLPATHEFLAHPAGNWAHDNLDPALTDYGVDAVWLLRADDRVVYHAARKASPPKAPAAQALVGAAGRSSRLDYFARVENELWQIYAAPVGPADAAAPAGWLLVGRRWDQDYLQNLANLCESEVRVTPATVDFDTLDIPENVELRMPLRDLSGRPLQQLLVQRRTADVAALVESGGTTIGLFLSFGSLLLIALVLAVRQWVLRPLGRIGDSLALGDSSLIAPLLRRRDEFTRVAQLVDTSFANKAALEREVAERRRAEQQLRASEEGLRNAVQLRGRLARDLHDTVIQSIYAAGLGLETVRAQMSEDPFGAEGRIKRCMESLNETIRQVRSYINDLEPDAPVQPQQFADAVRALTATMHELWPVEFDLELDDAIALRLSHVVETHALQIVRECISNALRHGAATRIRISLRANGGALGVLEVHDNGRGFDPAIRTGTGRGLVNLTTRARDIGATMRIEAAEGRGAKITFHLPLQEPGR